MIVERGAVDLRPVTQFADRDMLDVFFRQESEQAFCQFDPLIFPRIYESSS